MSAYAPTSLAVAFTVAALLAGALVLGAGISRLAPGGLARGLAWALVIGNVVAMDRVALAEPGGFRMLALCGVTLFSMKAVVSIEDTGARGERLPLLRWLAFAALWPGMRPAAFAEGAGDTTPKPPLSPLESPASLAIAGLVRLAIGAALLGCARLAWTATASVWLATALLLPGISLVLHFGFFNLGAALWRALGMGTARLFDAPLASKSLAEFWGRRWNIAFSEMSRLAVYRPLSPIIGKGPATAAAFVFSGLLHELAISLPVRAGFGLPLLYFALHGALLFIERAAAARGRAIDATWFGHVWTLAWLALPMPVLFHPWFLRAVVWPLVGISAE